MYEWWSNCFGLSVNLVGYLAKKRPMSTERREQLKRKSGRRLAAEFRKVLRVHDPATIDIEMFWPPDHHAINFLVHADRQATEWDFTIPTAGWQIASDPEGDFPSRLLADIRSFFRATWKDVCQKLDSDIRAYLRLHEDDGAVDLRNGRRIKDCDRADYVPPERRPFKKTGRSTKRKRQNCEIIRRGDTVAKVKRKFNATEDPDPKRGLGQSQYYWPDRGMRAEITNGKVNHIVYFDPFPDTICGIWIGAHAWEVHDILGAAKEEAYFSAGRIWQYDVKGWMTVGFDKNDRVRSISR